ncbi:MAG: hypothetical protein ACYDFT_03010 [Thermoplasmata archaeon]
MPARRAAEDDLRDDAEKLFREMARDGITVARSSLRIAGRIGRLGMAWAEATTERVAGELERRRHPPTRP